MAIRKNIISSGKKIFKTSISSFLNNTFVRQFADRHPKTFHFCLERFSLDKFTGLPLTFLVLAFIANLFLLNELIETLVNSEPLIRFDQAFARFLFDTRIHTVALAFFYFSKLGSFAYIVSAGFLLTSLYFMYKKYSFILPVWIALLGSWLTINLGKNYFHRIRPADLSFYQETSYSFPSGHATIAVAFYGFIFYSMIRSKKRYTDKTAWLITGLVFIGLLGFSRLYLCVHYLTDVMAGFSLGCSWLLLAISIAEWDLHRKSHRATHPSAHQKSPANKPGL